MGQCGDGGAASNKVVDLQILCDVTNTMQGVFLIAVVLLQYAGAFTRIPSRFYHQHAVSSRCAPRPSSAVEVPVSPALADGPQDVEQEIPTYLPSAMGVDYVPLATMLATGDFEGADQFTRDALIKIGGPGSVKRGFVYWTEVKNLPAVDLSTMERLWLQFSDGNYGYSVQKRVWDVENGNFDNTIRRIGWTTVDNGNERKLKWFGKSEFTYDMSAPKGHLPLTSALRGTQLFKELMMHPVWTQYDWKNYKDLKWGP